MNSINLLFLLLCSFIAFGQGDLPAPTPAQIRMESQNMRNSLVENSYVAHLPFENIGPTVMSGRITDIDVDPSDPTHFFVAYASGGLWKTENNGITFEPIFDNESVMTIGDIAVNWQKNEIWVGTGEVNSSRSSYAGNGIYKSIDGGKTWVHKGLPESHHIGRILIHPKSPDILWVAALGHLYSSNKERGVYKSTNGGDTWEQVLFQNENAGAVDLIMDPGNPNILYAALWERSRSSWNFVESGPHSGIYKTSNGGKNWTKISGGESGFPEGEGVGRIGFAIAKANGKTKLYALLDNQDRRPDEEEDEEDDDILVKEDFKEMTKEQFLELDQDKLESYLRSNRFPRKHSAKSVVALIKNDKIVPADLALYLENANSLLFDTPVIGAELYASNDNGKSWNRTHEGFLDGIYYSYGYYFGLVGVNPNSPEEVYIAGVPILKSTDGGKNFKSINGPNVHVDHHSLWISEKRQGHLINGNDGGINISYDGGENWMKCNSPSVGQFYYINVDNKDPYNVFGGLQDNGVWYGPSDYSSSFRWHSSGSYPYKSLVGGDGMQVQIDSRDNETIYAGSQFGNYSRLSVSSGQRSRITPSHELGNRPYRWNWQSPIIISPHNQDIIYFGAEVLFRSFNQGDDFQPISGDLTKGGKKGDVPYGTLTTIDESKLKFGLIYTGSDDGFIHCTQDGGNTWTLVSEGLPENMWVARVQASAHEESVLYTALNGYRWDDFNSYVYKSSDYGKNWVRIGRDLPCEPVNVIKEDPENGKLLYVGTDHGSYFSFDGGETFMAFNNGLPNVPVHDLVIQNREGDLLVGTHGRSIYKANIKPLRKLEELMESELYVFDISDIRYNASAGRQTVVFRDPTEPELDITVFANQKKSAKFEIQTKEGAKLAEKNIELEKGISIIQYDLAINTNFKQNLLDFLKESEKDEKKRSKIRVKEADNGKIYLQPGEYKLVLTEGNTVAEITFKVTDNNRSGR